MQQVFEFIRMAAESRSPVLILGETGTGKELVARTIHELGPCNRERFVPVDCSALAPTLIESELFGHVRGAFTGAVSHNLGLLRSAGEGTLFLDEIAELPPELQGRLLRAIEEHECKPVGSTRHVRFEGRIIAATHRNLVTQVKEDRFRKDLYYRLNVLFVSLPLLRERKIDIPLLTEQILDELHQLRRPRGGCSPPALSAEGLQKLLKYDWPGNVRELRNVLERAVTGASSPVIQADDLSLTSDLNDPIAGNRSDQSIIPLQELERQAILQAISACKGNKVLAARLLGIGKTTLYRKLQAFGQSE